MGVGSRSAVEDPARRTRAAWARRRRHLRAGPHASRREGSSANERCELQWGWSPAEVRRPLWTGVRWVSRSFAPRSLLRVGLPATERGRLPHVRAPRNQKWIEPEPEAPRPRPEIAVPLGGPPFHTRYRAVVAFRRAETRGRSEWSSGAASAGRGLCPHRLDSPEQIKTLGESMRSWEPKIARGAQEQDGDFWSRSSAAARSAFFLTSHCWARSSKNS